MQEMQAHSKQTNQQRQKGQTSPTQNKEPPKEEKSPPQRDSDFSEHCNNKPKPAQHSPQDMLEGLFHDKEKSLILMLILLLCTEKTDSGLILALLYLVI